MKRERFKKAMKSAGSLIRSESLNAEYSLQRHRLSGGQRRWCGGVQHALLIEALFVSGDDRFNRLFTLRVLRMNEDEKLAAFGMDFTVGILKTTIGIDRGQAFAEGRRDSFIEEVGPFLARDRAAVRLGESKIEFRLNENFGVRGFT